MKLLKTEPYFPKKLFLYGLRDLHPNDYELWTIPKSEQGGCCAYQLHQQIGARQIWCPKKHHTPAETARLLKAWRREFEKPWSQLSRKVKEYWMEHYVTIHMLPWSKLSEPISKSAADMPGEWLKIKIDRDLSKAELLKRFEATLPAMLDGHAPVRRKTETPKDVLSAIAAQRIYDCSGETNPMIFVEAYTDRFTSKQRFDDACRRYQRFEKTLRIGFTSDGRLRLDLDPEEYSRRHSKRLK